MASNKDDKDNGAEAEVLTDEQRISLLEKKAGTSRIVLYIVGLLLIIVTSVSITALSLLIAQSNNDGDTQALADVQTTLNTLQEQLNQHDQRLLSLNSAVDSMKGQVTNTSNAVLQTMLIEQEQHLQKFLGTLRSATFDLANMVPGSRAWLDLYSTEIDDAQAQSDARIQRLRSLKSGTAIDQGDPFFGDDF